jgi:perosamine synthetase
MHFKIPYAKPYLPGRTGILLSETFQNGQISGSGSAIQQLENSLQQILNTPKIITSCNGSAAIRLAFQLLDIRPGTLVVLPGWGFHVAANIAHSMGAKIEFKDVDSESWCLELSKLEHLQETKTKSILVLIHTLGNTSDLTHASNFTSNENLSVIEDSAEAFLSCFKNQQLGTIFDLGTFSMHAAKTITTGEGGFISINNEKLVEKGILLRNHGMASNNPYTHVYAGDNYRLSNLLGAIAIPQIEEIDYIKQERQRVYGSYKNFLRDSDQISFLKESDELGFFPWGVCIRFNGSENSFTLSLREHLKKYGIDTRPGFTSAENLPYYRSSKFAQNGLLRNSNLLAEQTILLPQYVTLKDSEIEMICALIKDFTKSSFKLNKINSRKK